MSTHSTRLTRYLEASLVGLLFLQAARFMVARLLQKIVLVINGVEPATDIVYAHLALAGLLVLLWISPRSRTLLPRVLMISAIASAVSRFFMALPFGNPDIALYISMVAFVIGAVYLATLIRANRNTWQIAVVSAIGIDQLLRAANSFDPTLRLWIDIAIGGVRYRVPTMVAVAVLCIAIIVVSILARRTAAQDVYYPAYLSSLGGLSLGAFLVLELVLLSLPGTVARWTGTNYQALVPWLLAATTLPLVPGIRNLMRYTISMFDEGAKGWVWLLILLSMLLVGRRLGGLTGASALVVAQLVVILLFWWIPVSPDPAEREQVGPSLVVGLMMFLMLSYLYGLSLEFGNLTPWLPEPPLIILLMAAIIMGLSRIPWREEDPWYLADGTPPSVASGLAALAIVLGLVISSRLSWRETVIPATETLRIASYNINHGYDSNNVFQLDVVAQTIEASVADIVILQEVDGGSLRSYGVDEAVFLARRLNMNHLYVPTAADSTGIAILSRWSIFPQASREIAFPEPDQGMMITLVQDPATARIVYVGNIRLTDATEEQRLQQLAILADMIGDSSPLVLGGDFGSTPQEVLYQQLIALGFQDPDALLGIERGFTTPAVNPTVRHDYLLLKGISPVDARHVESNASDHRLVVVEMLWP